MRLEGVDVEAPGEAGGFRCRTLYRRKDDELTFRVYVTVMMAAQDLLFLFGGLPQIEGRTYAVQRRCEC